MLGLPAVSEMNNLWQRFCRWIPPEYRTPEQVLDTSTARYAREWGLIAAAFLLLMATVVVPILSIPVAVLLLGAYGRRTIVICPICGDESPPDCDVSQWSLQHWHENPEAHSNAR